MAIFELTEIFDLSTSVLSYLGTILFVTWQVQYDQLGMGGGQEGGEFVS